MSVFSTNQVRQFYVATGTSQATNVTNDSEVGAIKLSKTKDEQKLYFTVKGADTVLRSDLIDKNKVTSISVTKAEKLGLPIKKATVTVLQDGIQSGQDYILHLNVRQFIGISDGQTFYKHGVVRGLANMSKATFYVKMAASLYMNFSREVSKLFEFAIGTATASTTIGGVKKDQQGAYVALLDTKGEVIEDTKLGADGNVTGAYTSVVITEAEQGYRRGIMEQVQVYYDVTFGTVTIGGDEVTWGNVAYDSTEKRVNGPKIADMEYFYMGERGDIYRQAGWPNNWDTQYLIDPTKNYNVLDVKFGWSADNEGVQISPKELTIVAENLALLDGIATELSTATGVGVNKEG